MTMVRVSELVALRIADVHFDDEYAKIRAGKGNKDRLVVVTRPLVERQDQELGLA
jgi:site-specific recombinase XerD